MARFTTAGSTAQAMSRCCLVAARTAVRRLEGPNGAAAPGASVNGTTMLSRVAGTEADGSHSRKLRATPSRARPLVTLTARPRGPQPSGDLSRPMESAGTVSVTSRDWPGPRGSFAWSETTMVPIEPSLACSSQPSSDERLEKAYLYTDNEAVIWSMGAAVGLRSVARTVSVSPGRATCGVIAWISIVTEAEADWAACATGRPKRTKVSTPAPEPSALAARCRPAGARRAGRHRPVMATWRGQRAPWPRAGVRSGRPGVRPAHRPEPTQRPRLRGPGRGRSSGCHPPRAAGNGARPCAPAGPRR